jgi:hypothetical protein
MPFMCEIHTHNLKLRVLKVMVMRKALNAHEHGWEQVGRVSCKQMQPLEMARKKLETLTKRRFKFSRVLIGVFLQPTSLTL